ncbi:DUF4374 domain-containing protein [Pseudofulvibacter geojedonensis]|uniref:DUF4374 domain-containing protein n=1 Tax=Pseudofulvibacter geojedonensis TaxID=1123758 RepID=A0ABW3I2G3_9FLAO
MKDKKLNQMNYIKKVLAVAAGLFLSMAVISCSNNDDDGTSQQPIQEVNYAFATVGGAWPSQTTYLQGTVNLDMTSINNNNATELANWGQLWTYNKDLFVTRFGAPATLFKYSFDSNGIAKEAGQIVIPGANTFSTIEFVSETEAYGTVAGGLARVIKFNPSTASVTGEIDLSSIEIDGVESYWYLGMKARDGKLFMGVEYQNNWTSTYDKAFVAVIDLETSTVEKVIEDNRTGNIFAAGGAVNGFNLDANGDLYVMGFGTANTPSGILRIKNGETEFDPSYFMNLDEKTGKACQGLWHFPGKGTFTLRMDDESDAYEFNGPNYKYYKIDLESQTAIDIGAPKTFGSKTSIIRDFNDGKLHFVIATASENAIYTYDIASGQISKEIDADGQITGFQKLN